MTPRLRKIHRQVWRVYLVLLPVLVIGAAGIRTKKVNDELPVSAVMDHAYKNEIGRSGDIVVYEVMTKDSVLSIGIDLHASFQSASAVAILESGGQDIILGKINHPGFNLFPVGHLLLHQKRIRIEDKLRKTTLAALNTH
jgi:hypothetical protein